jgi:general secretion pathway protein B
VAVDTGVRAVSLAQLSPEVRRELPPLALGGAIWSDNVASRFVIVNGQVLREGDAAAPGVVLERIGPKAVYLRWRDWRIEIPI